MNGTRAFPEQIGLAAVSRRTPDPSPSPSGLGQGGTTSIPAQAWSPDLPSVFMITVDSERAMPATAWGEVSGRGLYPLSRMGRLEHFCSTPAHYPLRIRFYVDSVVSPRPTPFRPPALTVSIGFTAASGSPRQVADVADPAPGYNGPGWPLSPAFGDVFSAGSSGSGTLAVTARMADGDTGVTRTYTDNIACELVPCV